MASEWWCTTCTLITAALLIVLLGMLMGWWNDGFDLSRHTPEGRLQHIMDRRGEIAERRMFRSNQWHNL
jgi:hypothetical protein